MTQSGHWPTHSFTKLALYEIPSVLRPASWQLLGEILFLSISTPEF